MLNNLPSKNKKLVAKKIANSSAEKRAMASGPMEVVIIKPKMSGIMKAIKSGADEIKNK